MKKLLFVFLSLFLAAGAIQAQDVAKTIESAEDMAKEANKALNAFILDNSRKDKLTEAWENAKAANAAVKNITKDQISGAFSKDKDAEKAQRAMSDILTTVGAVYREIATQITAAGQLGLDASELPEEAYPALQAAKAFESSLQFAVKSSEIKSAVDGLMSIQGPLNSMATIAFEQEKDYAKAYLNFNEVLVTHELIKQNGEASLLDAEGTIGDQMYFAGLSALSANMTLQANELFQKLYDDGYDNPLVFEAMYKVHHDKDLEKAYTYLEAGRKKYPEDTGLLFAEINHFLEQNRLDELIGKLEQAIAVEPENISLYATLGNVYDNLYQKEAKAGNKAKGMEYFDKALANFEAALEKDPKYFDAIYSIGALHYNNAAILVGELNELESDYSKEGLKKYETKKAEIFQKFDDALPYFQRCEKLDPNDVNTLIALREIYARKDDLATSDIFKERLEKVQSGGKNDSSYFQN